MVQRSPAAANKRGAPSSATSRVAPNRAPLTVAGCGRRASVRQTDSKQGDDLRARVLAVRTSVEIPGHVAEHEKVQAGVEVPRTKAARDALERERDEAADVEEAELVARNAVVRVELL